MTAEDHPPTTPPAPARHRAKTPEADQTTDLTQPASERDQRWAAAHASHWHNAGYSRETQARSETEDHT